MQDSALAQKRFLKVETRQGVTFTPRIAAILRMQPLSPLVENKFRALPVREVVGK